MGRRVVIAVLAALMGLSAAAPVLASNHGAPGPGNSHNGGCVGPPSQRLNGC